ncbi:MAG: NYN domain-containing protein [Lachnospiraceae bacterium]|nr:NYN domain-containing protein [Lachnospiraceae bacterium]
MSASAVMKYAVLIDGDNVAPKYLKAILEEIADLGEATYKRIYSDWTGSNRDSWKKVILEHSVMPVQQYSYTTGKNATDSAMIIDAMDILYTGDVDGFCLVSSDSDFTRLAARLREAGKHVIGFGEGKTPQAFRSACNSFKLLEVIYGDTENTKSPSKESLKITDIKEIKKAVYKIIEENDNKGKDTYIGEVGSKLANKFNDFDVRNYGCTKLSTLLEDKMENISLSKKNSTTLVSVVRETLSKEDVLEEIIRILKEHDGYINNMAVLNEGLKEWNARFSAKRFGYSKFVNFLASFPELFEIDNNEVKLKA